MGPAGPEGPVGPQGPEGTNDPHMLSLEAVQAQSVPNGQSRAWTWTVPGHAYLATARIDARALAEGESTPGQPPSPARLTCQMKANANIVDQAEWLITPDQAGFVAGQQFAQHSGLVSLAMVGAVLDPYAPDVDISVVCGAVAPDQFPIAIDRVQVVLVRTHSFVEFVPVNPWVPTGVGD